jgi:hypothetical protein
VQFFLLLDFLISIVLNIPRIYFYHSNDEIMPSFSAAFFPDPLPCILFGAFFWSITEYIFRLVSKTKILVDSTFGSLVSRGSSLIRPHIEFNSGQCVEQFDELNSVQ